MTDRDTLKLCAGDGGTDGLDVVDDIVGVLANTGLGSDTSGRVTVEILATDRNTNNQAGKVVTVGRDGGLQSSDFVVEGVARGPETEEKSSVLCNGGGNGGDGGVGSSTLLRTCQQSISSRESILVTYDHSVQTSTGKVAGSHKTLGRLELILEIRLHLDALIVESRAVVETLDSSSGGRDRHSHGQRVDELHVGHLDGLLMWCF